MIRDRGVLFLSLVVAAVGLWLLFVDFNSSTILFTNDIAVSLAVAERVLAGEFPLLGPPSHVGGRHLGPVYYYYAALCVALAGGKPLVTVYLFAVFKWLALLCTAALLSFFMLRKNLTTGLLGIGVCLLSGYYMQIIRTPWHGNYMLIPGCAYIATLCLAMRYRWAALPLLALTASLLVQSHFGTAPFVLGSFAVLAFYMYRNSECTPPEVPWVLNSRGVFWGISALAVLSWLPLLLYEVSYRSNLYKLFKVHLSDTHRVAGLLTTLEALFQVFKRFLFADYPFAALSNVLGAWTAALFCIALVALFCDYLMRSTRVVRYTWTAIGAGIACLVAALTSVKPPVHHYYFHFVSIVPALIAGIAFSRSVQIVWPRKEIASLYQRIWLWISRALAVVFLLIFVEASYHAIPLNFAYFSRKPVRDFHTLQHAEEVTNFIEQRRNVDQLVRVFTRGNGRERENAIYFLLGLEHYPFMQYAKSFRELNSFQRTRPQTVKLHAGINQRRARMKIVPSARVPSQAFVISCHPDPTKRMRNPGRRFSSRWVEGELLDLANCTSCNSCTVRRATQATLANERAK